MGVWRGTLAWRAWRRLQCRKQSGSHRQLPGGRSRRDAPLSLTPQRPPLHSPPFSLPPSVREQCQSGRPRRRPAKTRRLLSPPPPPSTRARFAAATAPSHSSRRRRRRKARSTSTSTSTSTSRARSRARGRSPAVSAAAASAPASRRCSGRAAACRCPRPFPPPTTAVCGRAAPPCRRACRRSMAAAVAAALAAAGVRSRRGWAAAGRRCPRPCRAGWSAPCWTPRRCGRRG